jgi:sugar lactone lactonase YvrE
VVNGAQTSGLGHFTVNSPSAPPTTTGSLVVNLSPAGAVSAGAQWQVDGGTYYSSGGVVPVLTPGSHTVSFKPISGYTTPANQNVTINANAQTTASGTYSVIAPSTYTLTINYDGVTGYIVNQPFGTGSGNVYNAGAVVQLTANSYFGYHFVSWGGDASGSGTQNPTTILMNGNKTVSANFAAGDPNLGTITVTILPPEAAAAGVTWGFNDTDFRASGSSYSYYPETVWVELHNTNGWVGVGGWVTFTAGQSSNYTFACSSTTGTIIGSDPRTYYTLAGSAGNSGSVDGTNSSARFLQPKSLALDKAGNIFVVDGSIIRKVTPTGIVTTIAGKVGISSYADGQGTNASFNNPQGIAIDQSNNLYVADMMNSVIRKITPDGTVSTFAGQAGVNGSVDATGSAASFYFPIGIAVDTNGNVYVADSVNETIRKITPSRVVSTLAGYPRSYGYADGTGSAARFRNPCGLALDFANNIYVADNANEVVRKVTQAGVVTTLAGYPGSSGAADGTGNVARFYSLNYLTVDTNGNVIVGDTSNQAIRKATPSGVVTTLAGQSGNPGSADGVGSVARFYQPAGVAVDSSGNLFVADMMNYTIRATQPLTTKVNQSIAFPTIPEHSAGDNPFTITATASSGLPVYFDVISGPAVLDTNNNLTLLGGGTVTVAAWQPGDSSYNPAQVVQQSFSVTKVPQTITFGSLSQQKVGDAPFPLTATTDSGLPVTYSASGPAILSGNIIALTGSGTVTITASQSGNNTYGAASNVVQSLVVLGPFNSIGSPQYATSGFELDFYGIVGSNYVYQASSNLLNWTTLLNFNCTNSIMNFQDTSATGYARRFYRIKPQ